MCVCGSVCVCVCVCVCVSLCVHEIYSVCTYGSSSCSLCVPSINQSPPPPPPPHTHTHTHTHTQVTHTVGMSVEQMAEQLKNLYIATNNTENSLVQIQSILPLYSGLSCSCPFFYLHHILTFMYYVNCQRGGPGEFQTGVDCIPAQSGNEGGAAV